MDIYCPKCGEPWDTYSLHDIVDEGTVGTYSQAVALFSRVGCEALECEHNGNIDAGRAEAMSVMFDVLGDDVDGIASMMDDFDYMGAFD